MRFPDAEVTTLDLLRHGEPVGGRMLRGTTDHPLSELGWQQMQSAFDARVGAAWQELLAEPPGRHVLVVCHLFVTNALLHQVLEQPLSRLLAFDLPYAATCRIRHERHARGDTSLVEWIGR
ncbi:phosphoglycerate mutase family protein [Halomonas sp. MA07-2]|uniref:phosphoglycerate mutase family protein n=1 Tax=Halomonas sp. MA07-2 TaxID=3440841 RepID=UPI003EEA1FA3